MPYRFLPAVALLTCLFSAMARAQATPEQVVVYGVLADSDLVFLQTGFLAQCKV